MAYLLNTARSSDSFGADEDGYMPISKLFPLPPAPPHMCRDEFLQSVLAPYTFDSPSSSAESSDSYSLMGTMPVKIEDFRAEEKLIENKLHGRGRMSFRKSLKNQTSLINRGIGIDLNQLLRNRYGQIANAIGFVAVLYLLKDVINQMKILRNMWSMSATMDRSLCMFSWSIDHYMGRFNRRNEQYLDNTVRTLKGQMDCYKFRVDLKEVTRLVDLLYEDYKMKNDICDNSLLAIRDAEVDVMELVTVTRKEAEEEQMALLKAMQNTPRSADPGGYRHKAINDKINQMDFLAPIEARYRINFAQATMEQWLMRDELKVKEIQKELEFLNDRSKEFKLLKSFCEMAFGMEIDDYKRRIAETEDAYEESMDLVDNEISITKNKLTKAVEELKFYQDQIPIFHRRIMEIQEIIEKLEEASRPPEPEPEIVPQRKKSLKKKKF